MALVSQWQTHPTKMVATVAMLTTSIVIQHGYLCVMTATERPRLCCRRGIRFYRPFPVCLGSIVCDECDHRVRLLMFVLTVELVESRLSI